MLVRSVQPRIVDTPNSYRWSHHPEEGWFSEEAADMADRRVTKTGKDSSGDITSLCGSWGSQTKSLAILDIELGTYRYYTHAANGTQADVQVVNGATGKYLRTDPDKTKADNLA